MDWIKTALQDSTADLYVGWDRKRRRNDSRYRVAVALRDYVVVIRMTGRLKAIFVTSYVADTESTIVRIRRSPRWHPTGP